MFNSRGFVSFCLFLFLLFFFFFSCLSVIDKWFDSWIPSQTQNKVVAHDVALMFKFQCMIFHAANQPRDP